MQQTGNAVGELAVDLHVELVDLCLLVQGAQSQAVARALGQRDAYAVDRERNQTDGSRQPHGFRHPRPREAAGDAVHARRQSQVRAAVALDDGRRPAVDGNVLGPGGLIPGERQHAGCKDLHVLRELRAVCAGLELNRSGPDADPAVRCVDAGTVQHRAAQMLASVEHPRFPATQLGGDLERLCSRRTGEGRDEQQRKQTAHLDSAWAAGG